MKTIKVTTLEAIKLEGGDAGSLWDALGEAIILSIRNNKIVRLRMPLAVYVVDPVIIRDAVAVVK